MNKLLAIGDFAASAGLSVSAVRFYGDRGLLLPAEVHPVTGYRSYLPSQIQTACLIRDLRLMGMPLANITAVIDLSGPDLAAAVAIHLDQLENNVERARYVASQLGHTDRRVPSASGSTIMRAADLATGFEYVLPSAATSEELPHLMTVRIEARGGSLRVAATDTHRLAVCDLVPIRIGTDFATLVAAATIRRLLSQIAGLDSVEVQGHSDVFSMVSDGTDLCAGAVPAEFPAYEPYLERPTSCTSVLVDQRNMWDALESFDEFGAVLLSTAHDSLRIERRGHTVEVPARIAGPEVHVAVNPLYAIGCIDGASEVEITVEVQDDSLAPVTFRTATDGTSVSVLMPVQME